MMDFADEMIEAMLERGYLIQVGENSMGEPLYRLTEKFHTEHADLVEEIKLNESDLISSLWFKNFIDIRMNVDGASYIYLTNKSDDWYTSDELTEEEKSMMYILYTTGYFDDFRDRR
jgi:hypothetical protein